MANTFKLETKKNIGTADSAVYTCPGGTATTIIGMNLANTTSSAITADVTILNNGGDSCFLVKDAPIPIGSSLVAVGGDQKPGFLINPHTEIMSFVCGFYFSDMYYKQKLDIMIWEAPQLLRKWIIQ